MTKRIPALALWLVLAVVSIAIPMACSSDSTTSDAAMSSPG